MPAGGRRPAGVGARRRLAREAAAPFRGTSRWLRGRILDALRDTPADAWARLDSPIGGHDAAAVETALAGLDREGLVERHPTEGSLARLPLA
jgi:hypothetical protein